MMVGHQETVADGGRARVRVRMRPPAQGATPHPSQGQHSGPEPPDGRQPPDEGHRSDVEYQRLVEEGVLDERRFVRAVFSGRRRGHAVPWERVVLRPVEIKGRPHVQFTYH